MTRQLTVSRVLAAIPPVAAEEAERPLDSLSMMFRQLESFKVRWHLDCRSAYDCEIRTEDGTVGRGMKVGDALAELLTQLGVPAA
jgi:hypothetical protein